MTSGAWLPEPEIDCIDCGGRAHLLTPIDEESVFRPGDLVVYRCADCLDRWDLEAPAEAGLGGGGP